MACSNGESIDVATYQALHTSIDLAGMYDLIELKEVHASHAAAAYHNAQEEAERKAGR